MDCGLDVIRLRCVPIVLVEGLELLDALSVSDWPLSFLFLNQLLKRPSAHSMLLKMNLCLPFYPLDLPHDRFQGPVVGTSQHEHLTICDFRGRK